ncbi:MAG: hypothetical protein V2A73_17340, partial [Pseudomonadota bacterium]
MSARIVQILARLQGDEGVVVEAILDRIVQGRAVYGPWRVNDGRDYPEEALAEVIDALHYCAAELVRLRRERDEARPDTANRRRRRVYVCHPYGGDPEGNSLCVAGICRSLVEAGFMPIAPHLYLSAFIDERDERELALDLCLDLVAA